MITKLCKWTRGRAVLVIRFRVFNSLSANCSVRGSRAAQPRGTTAATLASLEEGRGGEGRRLVKTLPEVTSGSQRKFPAKLGAGDLFIGGMKWSSHYPKGSGIDECREATSVPRGQHRHHVLYCCRDMALPLPLPRVPAE